MLSYPGSPITHLHKQLFLKGAARELLYIRAMHAMTKVELVADVRLVAYDANASDRRADAIRLLVTEGGLTLTDAIDALTPPRAPQIGDILACSWGYGQTRVDFYEVTKVTAKTVTVHEIEKHYLNPPNHGDGDVVPVASTFKADEKPLTSRRFSYPVGNSDRRDATWRYSIRITAYSHAYLWDGEACSESGDY